MDVDLVAPTLQALDSGSHDAASLADVLQVSEDAAGQVLETLLGRAEVVEVVPGLFVRRTEPEPPPEESWEESPTVVTGGFEPPGTGIELWDDARAPAPTLEPAPPVSRPRSAAVVPAWTVPVVLLAGFSSGVLFAGTAALLLA